MKQTRRRRHLRPRPTRAQVNLQIARVRSTLQAFQLEWMLEAQHPHRSLARLQFLENMVRITRDELSSLEELS
jgi:hypothetical protein